MFPARMHTWRVLRWAMPDYNPRRRIQCVAVAILAVSLLLLGRLFDLQIIRWEYYQGRAEARVLGAVEPDFFRGSISFHEEGGISASAATMANGYTLGINPSTLGDPVATYEALNSIVALDPDDFLKKALKTNDPYERVKERLTESEVRAIKKLGLSGIEIATARWRTYPGGERAAHVLGFVGYQGDTLAGRYGLERYYNDILERNTEGMAQNFFVQVFSELGGLLTSQKIKQEADLILTIESRVQGELEKELRSTRDTWNASAAGGIVIDPKTGEILAMAATPSFDPGFYGKENDVSVFTNPLVENVYEMGSIMKPLTLAAAIDAGAITEHTTYDDKGYVIVGDKKIENFDKKGRGVVPMQEVLNNSLNTGAVFAMQELGREKFREYMFNYGLGERTRVDLPDEALGLVKNLESSRDIEYATASFGQGIAVTPIAMVRALGALANGGYLIRPHVVGIFDYRGFPRREVKIEEQRKVLAEATTETITRMLVKTVDEALVSGAAKMLHYSIAAKTGTAQIPHPTGGYYDDRYLHSFFGYYPAYEPRFLVFLFLTEPKEVRYASQTLTEPFMRLASFLLSYYEVPPDR